jgi:hypothetical protein
MKIKVTYVKEFPKTIALIVKRETIIKKHHYHSVYLIKL